MSNFTSNSNLGRAANTLECINISRNFQRNGKNPGNENRKKENFVGTIKVGTIGKWILREVLVNIPNDAEHFISHTYPQSSSSEFNSTLKLTNYGKIQSTFFLGVPGVRQSPMAVAARPPFTKANFVYEVELRILGQYRYLWN